MSVSRFQWPSMAKDPKDRYQRPIQLVHHLTQFGQKFGLSEGMIVAAGGGGGEVYLLAPDDGAKPGQRVH